MHEIDIPQAIVDRSIARRGAWYVYDTLDPARTALLVIDMQNCFLAPGFSVIEVPATRDIVDNINTLAAATRRGGGLVVWTQHTFRPDWTVWHDYFAHGNWRERMIAETAEGSFGYAIHETLDVGEEDLVVLKKRYSALIPGSTEPDVTAKLRHRGIDTVIIVGTLTNVCCESTARDAMMLDFKTLFVADANATRSDAEHNATLVSMIQVFADVRFTDDVVTLLDQGAKSRHRAAE
jgi:ureidoacrylate peracid hydrolase